MFIAKSCQFQSIQSLQNYWNPFSNFDWNKYFKDKHFTSNTLSSDTLQISTLRVSSLCSLQNKYIALVVSAYAKLGIYKGNVQPAIRIEYIHQQLIILLK